MKNKDNPNVAVCIQPLERCGRDALVQRDDRSGCRSQRGLPWRDADVNESRAHDADLGTFEAVARLRLRSGSILMIVIAARLCQLLLVGSSFHRPWW